MRRYSLLLVVMTLTSASATFVHADDSGTADPRAPAAGADSAQTKTEPNRIPYRTSKSIVAHVLSLPATVWHVAWQPLGAGIVWAEQNQVPARVINLFLNDERTGGVYPMIGLGGNTAAAIGLVIFHNDLTGEGESISLSGLFRSTDNNTASLRYADPELFGTPLGLLVSGDFFSDSDENLFLGGNNSTEDDETSYDTEQGTIGISVTVPITSGVDAGVASRVHYVDISVGEGAGADMFPTDLPGFGKNRFVSVGSDLAIDYREGGPRTLTGGKVELEYRFTKQIDDDLFAFHHISGEVQQFVPFPALPKTRRFATRVRLEYIEEHNEDLIPFYATPVLGSADGLRGYDEDRFRAAGSLLFNFEYRYPIWDTWDGVIFVDEGQVFDRFEDLRSDRFHWGAGAGLRFMSAAGFIMRTEIAFSRETVRALFQLAPNF